MTLFPEGWFQDFSSYLIVEEFICVFLEFFYFVLLLSGAERTAFLSYLQGQVIPVIPVSKHLLHARGTQKKCYFDSFPP